MGGRGLTRVVVAPHDRLIVTHSEREGTVVVLQPPGVTPEAVLRLARLVLRPGAYDELARQLGHGEQGLALPRR